MCKLNSYKICLLTATRVTTARLCMYGGNCTKLVLLPPSSPPLNCNMDWPNNYLSTPDGTSHKCCLVRWWSSSFNNKEYNSDADLGGEASLAHFAHGTVCLLPGGDADTLYFYRVTPQSLIAHSIISLHNTPLTTTFYTVYTASLRMESTDWSFASKLNWRNLFESWRDRQTVHHKEYC